MLAKTVWRITLAPGSLVHHVLKGKYFQNSSWAAALLGSKHSLIWSSLLWVRELLQKGLRWRVQDGNSIHVWGDKWIPRPWNFQVVSPISLPPSTKVSELMSSPGVWNHELIQTSFLLHEVEAILPIPLACGRGSDIAIWHYHKDGRYSVNSGYRLAMDLQTVEATAGEGCSGETNLGFSKIWVALWRLKVVNKVKIFIWRACHDFLPCASNLCKRKIGSDSTCLRCGCLEESTIHALWYCKAARKVWKHTCLNGVYKVWQETSFLTLFSHVATDFSKAELELFAMVAWWIWKNRNDIKFGKQGMSGEQIVSKARDWAYEFAAAQAPVISATSRVSFPSQPMKWCCPQLQFTKLNVDAANDKSNSRTGFGAVIRNDQGKLMCAATEAISGLISVYAAEARAILFGLEICKKEGFGK